MKSGFRFAIASICAITILTGGVHLSFAKTSGKGPMNMIDASGKRQGHWMITWEMVYGQNIPGPLNRTGIAAEGDYLDSRREGHWDFYHPNQVKSADVSYSKGLRDGNSVSYSKTGNVQLKMLFRNDLPDSVMTFYYPDGTVLATYTWSNGKLDGPAKTYWDDGRLCEEGIWKHGYWESKPRYHHRLR